MTKTFTVQHFKVGYETPQSVLFVKGSKLLISTDGWRGNGAVVFKNPRGQQQIWWFGNVAGFGSEHDASAGRIEISLRAERERGKEK